MVSATVPVSDRSWDVCDQDILTSNGSSTEFFLCCVIAILCSCSWFRSGRIKWNGARLRAIVTWSGLAARRSVDNQPKVLCVHLNVNNQNGFEVSQVCAEHVQQDQMPGLLWIQRGTFGSCFGEQQGESDLCFAPAWKKGILSFSWWKSDTRHILTLLVAKFDTFRLSDNSQEQVDHDFKK